MAYHAGILLVRVMLEQRGVIKLMTSRPYMDDPTSSTLCRFSLYFTIRFLLLFFIGAYHYIVL